MIGFIYAHPHTSKELRALDLAEVGQRLVAGNGLAEKRQISIKEGKLQGAPCVACQFVGELEGSAMQRVRVIATVHRGHLIQLWFTGVDGPEFAPAARDFYAAVALNAE